MAKKEQADRTLLLELLNQWSLRHGLGEDPYLNSLIKTVENRLSVDVLGTLDPEKYLPRPKSEAGSGYIKTSKYLAILRNVLVFAPVAITWKAVSEATTAFSRFVSDQKLAPVNFLEFWQNGYGVLGDFWKIGNIAQIDFLLILFIIIATLASTLLLNYGRSRDVKVQKVFDQEREVVIFEIKTFLYSPSTESKEAIDETLRVALRNLTAAAQSISVAAEKLERSIARQAKSIAEGQEVSREIKTFQRRILSILKRSSE